MSNPRSFSETIKQFETLVSKVHYGRTARSENDLSSALASVLRSLGLSTVIDSTVTNAGRKRPDILGYVSAEDADLVLPAEIVIEAKRPEEVAEFNDLRQALTEGWLWNEKAIPYIRANITRVQYFVLTTFAKIAILPINTSLRDQLRGTRYQDNSEVRDLARDAVIEFQLAPSLPDSDPCSCTSWIRWISMHFVSAALAPISISEIHNSLSIDNRAELEGFATRLADFAAGSTDDELANAGLFHSVRKHLPQSVERLDSLTLRDLHVFLMTQHPGMGLDAVQTLAKDAGSEVLDEFIAASIHSLIGRLFAFKAIEDIFCIHELEPLIERKDWIFATTRYDTKSAEEIRAEAFRALRGLKTVAVSAVQRFAVYGFFFDWIERHIDPVVFRSLIEMLASHDFENIEGELRQMLALLHEQRHSEWVFPSPKRFQKPGESEKHIQDVKNAFRRAVRLSKIAPITFHQLRHTFCSRLANAGVPMPVIQDLAGHASITMTRRYTHSADERKRMAVEGLLRGRDETKSATEPATQVLKSPEPQIEETANIGR